MIIDLFCTFCQVHTIIYIYAILLVTVCVVYFVCLQVMMKADTIYSKTLKKNMKMEISVTDFNNLFLRLHFVQSV